MARKLIMILCATLVACGRSEDEPGPGGVSIEDARALDEAAAKLDDGEPATEGKPEQ